MAHVKTQTELASDHANFNSLSPVVEDLIDSVITRKGSDKVTDLTTTATLTADDSGKIFTLDSAGGAYDVNLPAVADAAGCVFTFVVKENTPTADITLKSDAANIFGNLAIQSDNNEDNRVACAGVTNVLIDTTALQGDSVTFIGTGTMYVVSGFGQVQGAFTVS